MRRYTPIYALICSISLLSCRTTYHVDEFFDVSLDKQGLGGYQWEYIGIPEVVVVESLDQAHKNENGFHEYTRIYKMKALKKGCYNLKFIKKRSFEQRDSINNENIKNIKVRIRN